MIELWIKAKLKGVSALHRFGNKLHADIADAYYCKCSSCGCECGDVLTKRIEEVTCSNCYSEKVYISLVRLTFHNWGNQNGGEKEMRERADSAIIQGALSEPPRLEDL